MNRHGDKQASKLHAHAVCKPGAVCDPASDPDLVEVPQADVPARSALAFGETEGVPTLAPVALRKPPVSAHLCPHYLGSLSPFPRPSPGSSACTPYPLMSGPSGHL